MELILGRLGADCLREGPVGAKSQDGGQLGLRRANWSGRRWDQVASGTKPWKAMQTRLRTLCCILTHGIVAKPLGQDMIWECTSGPALAGCVRTKMLEPCSEALGNDRGAFAGWWHQRSREVGGPEIQPGGRAYRTCSGPPGPMWWVKRSPESRLTLWFLA